MTREEYFSKKRIAMKRDDMTDTARDGWEWLMCPYEFGIHSVKIHDEFRLESDAEDETLKEVYAQPRKIIGYCKDCDYRHAFIELDAGIGEMVSELNKKGYYTFYSCEGHPELEESPLAYIYFQFNKATIPYVLDLFSDLPTSWFLDLSDLKRDMLIIRSDNLSDSLYLLELQEWVETLPKCPVEITLRLTIY